MKKKYKQFSILCSLLLGISFLYTSCEDYDYKTSYSWLDKVSSINIENTVDDVLPIHLYRPEKLSLTFTTDLDIEEMDIRTFHLISSDTNVFKIDLLGDIQPKGLGTAKLLVKHRVSEKLTTTCDVHVWSNLEDIIAKADPILVKVGNPSNINDFISLVPAVVDNTKLYYESLNPEFITIDKDGKMDGLKEGMAKIQITSDPDSQGKVVTKVFNIEVKDKILVSRIVLNGMQGPSVDISKLNTIVGQVIDIATNLVVGPEDADVKDVTYEVDNKSVGTVSEEGVLTIVGKGIATLTIKPVDGSDVKKVVTIDSNSSLYARDFWGISTSIIYDSGNNYIPDGATGKPEHMFDGSTTTFLSLAKPGKTPAKDHTTPIDHQLFFMVDMKAKQDYNYIVWKHRSNNSTAGLRVWGISVYGSDDGENFTPIVTDLDIPYSMAEPDPIEIPKSNYRYVKIHYDKFSTTQSMSLQVSEFGLGLK